MARQFSMGAVFAIPQGANPTPIPFAFFKGADVEVNQTKVDFRGQFKAPIDFGDGPLDIKLKIDALDIRGTILSAITSGATTVVGSKLVTPGSETTTIPTTPFQYTVAQTATFVEDGGVYDVTAGKWLTRVASAPTTGQYSVSGVGLYTFAAADVAHIVAFTYVYSSASVGFTTSYSNVIQGPSTFFLARVYNIFTVAGVNRPLGWEFPQTHFGKLAMALKVGAWMEPTIEAACSADVGQTLYKAYTGD